MKKVKANKESWAEKRKKLLEEFEKTNEEETEAITFYSVHLDRK